MRSETRRWICRAACISVAAGHTWAMRYVMNPDGTAYMDIAKAWLRGDWQAALNSYWSPLYSLLLAPAIAVMRPGIAGTIPLTHVVCLAGFLLAMAAWEFVWREWERWQGPPADRALMEVTGYATILWGGIHMIETAYNSADIFVVALLLAACGLTIRVRSGAARARDYAGIGLALGLAYLAKTALLIAIPVWLATIAVLRVRPRQVAIAGVAAALVCTPYIAPLSVANGRLTAGDAGALNYAWLVDGMTVEGYKDNVNPPNAGARAADLLMADPRVVTYAAHPVGTMPMHNNPAWWCLGYRPHFDARREAMVLWRDLGPLLLGFAGCPALWLLIGCAVMGRPVNFAGTGFVLPTALTLVGGYWAVMVLPRYVAAPFLLLAFAMLASVWKIAPGAGMRAWAMRLLPVGLAGVMWVDLAIAGFFSLGEALGKVDPPSKPNVGVALAMAREGMRPGDRIAYIGDAQEAAWVGLANAQVIAEVPGAIWQNDAKFGRPVQRRFESSDRFWGASRERREQVLEAFRGVGARWVCADAVPAWADVNGWRRGAETLQWRDGDSRFLYFRNLDETVRSSR